jgi:hypothetical protein
MLRYSLKDFYLGNSDGKKEAQYKKDFEQYFYDYNDLYERATTRERYLILGRKGTGKTLLAEIIYKKSSSNPNCFCEICSYKEFKFHELLILKSEDISPNEYISIWEWVILIQIGKMCCRDEGIKEKDLKSKLKKFIFNNFSSLDINSNKIIEITKNNAIGGTLANFTGGVGKGVKSVKGSYLNYLESLREVILSLLRSSDSQYLLIYDELDDRFRDEPAYKDSLISLIKATDKINLKFFKDNLEAKVSLLLRTDIYSILNDPDLNKIKEDNAVVIDWGRNARRESPLFDLVFTKIKISTLTLRKHSREDLFGLLFPQNIYGIPPEQFILERTFFRPRDVITFLNKIIEKHPTTQYFGAKGFMEVQGDYSKYFFQEVRNELSGHLPDVEIDESTLLLKQFNRPHFCFEEIETYFKRNKALYRNINLEKALTMLFKFSVIGNRWKPINKPHGFHYSWTFRDDKAAIDFDKEFVVHLGLRRELSL